MIKTIAILAMLCFQTYLMAQDFQGIATYKSHRKVDLKMDEESVNSEMQKQIQQQLQKQFQQEYTLTFNKNESMYKREEKLEAPNPTQSGISIKIQQGSDILYKNIKENRFTNKTEIFGKRFLVKDTLSNRPWKLINETKNIGNYTCFKAVFTDSLTTQTINEAGEIKKTIKERTTTVWYTPQIPVSNGPDDFYGLPGLILEVNDGDLTLVCSKIVINPTETIEIVEPTKGKEVTQTEYREIMDKKEKEMMDQFQTRRSGNDG